MPLRTRIGSDAYLTFNGQGLAIMNRRVKLAEKCRDFKANPQDSGFSDLRGHG